MEQPLPLEGVLVATNSHNDTRNEAIKDENLGNFSKTNLKEVKNDLISTASLKNEESLMSPKQGIRNSQQLLLPPQALLEIEANKSMFYEFDYTQDNKQQTNINTVNKK
jgi:hypothetical protein